MEIYKGEPWLTAWLAFSLLAAMAIIAGLILFYAYALPVRFVTVMPKDQGPRFEHVPLFHDFERPYSRDVIARTHKLEI